MFSSLAIPDSPGSLTFVVVSFTKGEYDGLTTWEPDECHDYVSLFCTHGKEDMKGNDVVHHVVCLDHDHYL